ncbi:MAG: hypothetical protein ABI306_00790, partial [Caulobacteraceae bacterium]
AGRFALALDEPLSVGDHQLALNGAGLHTETRVSISPAEPLRQGPFRAQLTPSGWRIDWMTPGGGAQTTLLIDSPGPVR